MPDIHSSLPLSVNNRSIEDVVCYNRLPSMSNHIRATMLNPTLVPHTGNTERILRDQDLLFHTVYNHENPGSAGTIEQERIHKLDEAFSSLNHEGPPPSLRSGEQPASAAVILDVESSLRVCDHT